MRLEKNVFFSAPAKFNFVTRNINVRVRIFASRLLKVERWKNRQRVLHYSGVLIRDWICGRKTWPVSHFSFALTNWVRRWRPGPTLKDFAAGTSLPLSYSRAGGLWSESILKFKGSDPLRYWLDGVFFCRNLFTYIYWIILRRFILGLMPFYNYKLVTVVLLFCNKVNKRSLCLKAQYWRRILSRSTISVFLKRLICIRK